MGTGSLTDSVGIGGFVKSLEYFDSLLDDVTRDEQTRACDRVC